MSVETELRALGKYYSREREHIVNEWKSNNPNFKGFMENSAFPGLKELEEQTKQKHFEILKKYNKL